MEIEATWYPLISLLLCATAFSAACGTQRHAIAEADTWPRGQQAEAEAESEVAHTHLHAWLIIWCQKAQQGGQAAIENQRCVDRGAQQIASKAGSGAMCGKRARKRQDVSGKAKQSKVVTEETNGMGH